MDGLISILNNYIATVPTGEYIGLLYSGGIDSSIIGKILTDIYKPSHVIASSVGLKDSYDLVNAANGATELGITFIPEILNEDNLSRTLSRLKRMDFIKNAVHFL